MSIAGSGVRFAPHYIRGLLVASHILKKKMFDFSESSAPGIVEGHIAGYAVQAPLTEILVGLYT
ncbi:MAG: hypothetical protein M1312_00300 [Patescibacteria group bacterium]|nr:hypothetical protein [Patescibacteria group bacterium]